MSEWSVALIDAPWPKKKGGLRSARPNQSRSLDYSTMSVAEIFDLLDRDIFCSAAAQHTVFLWGIDEFLLVGEQAMKERGYRMHARLIWDKCNGVAPAFSVRFSHEYLGWFYKPKFTPVDIGSRGKLMTVIREPARQHSRKPEAVYTAIETWFPSLPKIDVFSRQDRNGWESYGNEMGKFNTETQL